MKFNSLSSVYDAYGNRKYLTFSERKAFLDAATNTSPDVMTFCFMLAYTGARISEVLALTPARIDHQAGVIVFETLKRRRRGLYRAVPVPPEFFGVLNHVHHVVNAQKKVGKIDEPIWLWCRTTAWTRVKEIMAIANIVGVQASPKGLRHAFGVLAVQSGVPLNMVQKWLGHADLSTTVIYANAVGEEEVSIASKLWDRL